MILKNRISRLLISTSLIILTACSNVSNVNKFSDALINSSIGESKISYGGDSWYDFVKQDSDIQNYYIEYLKEIGKCLSEIELKKTNEDEFDGIDTILISLNKDNKNYEFNLKYIYPDTSCLKVSIDNKTEYYLLDKESSEKLSNIILESYTRPFNHISLAEYLQNED
jgi:hypothetical protein